MSPRSSCTTAAITLLIAAAPGLAACGDQDAQSPSSARTGTPASAPQGEIPDELAGTWQTTIEHSEIADPPDDLDQRRSVWTLRFLGTGGGRNGPSVFLSNDRIGEIVKPISLSGDEITLEFDTDCRKFTLRGLGTESVQILSAESDTDCPSTLISSILHRQWRLLRSDSSRRGPTTAEVNLFTKDQFLRCARQYGELGVIVGYRGGEAVAVTRAGTGGGEFDTRVSAPRAIASVLADGGQYLGLREGDGPDLDILIHGSLDGVASAVSSLIDEEAGRKAIVGASGGTIAHGRSQTFLFVSLDHDAPSSPERKDALNTCLRRAAAATRGYVSQGSPDRRQPSG